jgi:hypothetical protein
MPLKTRQTFPPGGFPYIQKKADGTVHKFDGLTYGFWDQCARIKEYRVGNGLLPTDLQAIATELDSYQCERLGFDPNWVESKKKSPWAANQFSPSHVLRQGAALAAGANILKDWLGEGGIPVTQELAQSRANICLNCPQNQEGHFVQKLTTIIAKAIHDQRREKLRMALRVDGEEELHTCAVCSCHLPLKVWVPFQTIAERTTDVQWKEFEAVTDCWVNKEKSNG